MFWHYCDDDNRKNMQYLVTNIWRQVWECIRNTKMEIRNAIFQPIFGLKETFPHYDWWHRTLIHWWWQRTKTRHTTFWLKRWLRGTFAICLWAYDCALSGNNDNLSKLIFRDAAPMWLPHCGTTSCHIVVAIAWKSHACGCLFMLLCTRTWISLAYPQILLQVAAVVCINFVPCLFAIVSL